MRNYIIAVLLCAFSFNNFAQDINQKEESENTEINRWSLTAGYGFASYMSIRRGFESSNAPHGVFEFTLDYKLKNNASLGFSFLKSTMRTTFDRSFQYEIGGVPFQFNFSNYQSIFTRNIYEIHYKNFYWEKRLSTSIGLYVFNDRTNVYFPLSIKGEDYYYFGASFAVAYQYPIKDYMDVGINARGLFSLDGTDFILLPFVRFSF